MKHLDKLKRVRKMTRIRVSVNDPKTGKPRVGVVDPKQEGVKVSDGRVLPEQDIIKVFPKQGDKK